MEKIKCKCGKDWKIQDNLSAYEGEVVLVCDCGERFYNAPQKYKRYAPRFINVLTKIGEQHGLKLIQWHRSSV